MRVLPVYIKLLYLYAKRDDELSMNIKNNILKELIGEV